MMRLAARFCALVVVLVTPVVYAAPLDDRIPQDALLYAGWQGADALAPQYATSNLKGLVDNSGMAAYLQEQIPKWIDLAGQQDPTAPAQIQIAETALGVFWHHPTAVYVGPADFSNPKAPQFRGALLCDAGTDATMLTGLLAFAQNAAPPEAHVVVTADGGLVMVTVGLTTPDQLKPHADSLSASATYVKTMKQVGGAEGALVIYKDPRKFLDMIDHGVEGDASITPEDRKKYHAVLDTLGIQSMTQAAYRGGFDGKGWAEDIFIGTSGPHTGLLALFDGAPVDDATLALIPAEAVSFRASHFNASGILPFVREVASRIGPEAVDGLNKAIDQADLQLGFDMDKDLLGALGDTSVVYRMPSPDGVGLTTVFVQKLKDAVVFSQTLKTLEGQINTWSEGRLQVEPTDADGIQVSALQSPFFSMAWVVRNGYFYASTVSGISAAINQVEKHPSDITANETYKTARAALPNVKATSIEYSDPAKLYPEGYRSAATIVPLLRMAKIDVPMKVLPTPAKALPFLTPGASIFWSDGDGFHVATRSAIPGG
jgi:hypothetical protein